MVRYELEMVVRWKQSQVACTCSLSDRASSSSSKLIRAKKCWGEVRLPSFNGSAKSSAGDFNRKHSISAWVTTVWMTDWSIVGIWTLQSDWGRWVISIAECLWLEGFADISSWPCQVVRGVLNACKRHHTNKQVIYSIILFYSCLAQMCSEKLSGIPNFTWIWKATYLHIIVSLFLIPEDW